jgi:hypothetical protein
MELQITAIFADLNDPQNLKLEETFFWAWSFRN